MYKVRLCDLLQELLCVLSVHESDHRFSEVVLKLRSRFFCQNERALELLFELLLLGSQLLNERSGDLFGLSSFLVSRRLRWPIDKSRVQVENNAFHVAIFA